VIDDVACMIEPLNTYGQEEYTGLQDAWIREEQIFVLVYSVFSRTSFTRVNRYHSLIRRVKTSLASPDLYPRPTTNAYEVSIPSFIMLVAHDFHDKLEGERRVSETEGRSLATELGCDFIEASAKNGTNVDNIFFDVVRKLRSHRAAVVHLSRSS
jgi:GTPase KRas protein